MTDYATRTTNTAAHDRNEWEIDMTELELGEQLGTGGYAHPSHARGPS